MKHCLDVRIWGPLLVAIGAALWRGLPQPVTHEPTDARAIELPPLYPAPLPRGDADYVLDAERSSVRFLIDTGGQPSVVACERLTGRLRVVDGGERRELDLDLDLGSLRLLGDTTPALDLWHLLGVHRGSQVIYRAEQVRTTTSPLPGTLKILWLGSLRLDARVVQQPMELWQVSLPGQPLRLQGHGSVASDTFGLPSRSWLGVAPRNHVVTLGLDLAFRRERGR